MYRYNYDMIIIYCWIANICIAWILLLLLGVPMDPGGKIEIVNRAGAPTGALATMVGGRGLVVGGLVNVVQGQFVTSNNIIYLCRHSLRTYLQIVWEGI